MGDHRNESVDSLEVGQAAQLGELYAEGRGVPRDDTEALKWYSRAAAQKDFRGQLGLGRMYAAGHGVPDDVCAQVGCTWALNANRERHELYIELRKR